MVEWLHPKEQCSVSRAEQDRQEMLFSLYQEKLKKGLITKSEYEELFYIIHNCVVSQLKKRISRMKENGLLKQEYTEEEIEDMALDATCSLLRNIKKTRVVRYIIKTSDYLAMYQIYNERKKFSDKVNKKALSLELIEKYFPAQDVLDIDDEGNVKIKRKGYTNEFNA